MMRRGTVPVRDLAIPGFANLRDVGGYRIGATGSTRWRALLRADMPSAVDAHDLRTLVDLPVGTVVDLRDDDEVALAPSVFAGAAVELVRHPVLDGSAASFVERRVDLTTLYAHMVTTCARALTGAVRAIADADPSSAVLVHCSAGKDRTGVTVALALRAVGVDRRDVVADYAATEQRLRGPWLTHRLAELEAYHGTDLSGSVELLAGSPASAIDRTLDLVDRTWGSAVGYLTAHGLTAEALDRLGARLSSPTAPADAA